MKQQPESKRAALPLGAVITVDCEQNPGLGEDSTLCSFEPGGRAALIACLDGCGGSGAKRYPAAGNFTGARIASRKGCDALCGWFDKNRVSRLGVQGASGETVANSLRQALEEELSYVDSQIDLSSTAMKGSLSASLPTTLSAAVIEQTDDAIRCLYLWAGDSRGFLFTPEGLRQTTADDIQGGFDPFDNLERDGLLSNFVSARGGFTVHSRDIYAHSPSMVITATDGCFSYFTTPMEFEGTLLKTLSAAQTPIGWEEALKAALGEIASDDYSMQIALVGFDSFWDVKRAFSSRTQEFLRRWGEPVEICRNHGDREGMHRLWLEYKDYYMFV